MTVLGSRHLQLEITHLCNKNCPLCDHRIRYSDYKYLTREEYSYLASCIRVKDFDLLTLTGGEPLCHPHFEELVGQITKDFEGLPIQICTNGLLLPQLSNSVLERLYVVISHYPGFNDDIVAEFESLDKVTIKEFVDFWNPYRDPRLSQDEAKWVYSTICSMRHVRVVGTKLYSCCLAEGIERYYDTDSVHVEFSVNWREDWLALPTWKVCQHCFKVFDFAEDGLWIGE